MPTISVLIPTRDRAGRLATLLSSMRTSGYLDDEDIEVIVIDNNSSDDATKVVCDRFPAVTYICAPMPGRSAAINAGLRHAAGRYIAFTDDDVIVKDPQWLYRLAANFADAPNVGYASGRVIAYQTDTSAQRMWESKGGLSKGVSKRVFDAQFFRMFRPVGVPVRLMAAGANSVIPRHVIEKVGTFDERFGIGAAIPHGESLDICYRVLRLGYTAVYDPEAVLYHQHPASLAALRRKMFIYGIGDTAVHTKFLFEYGDIRSMFEVLWGRPFMLVGRLIASMVGKYPMSPDMLVSSLTGALLGPWVYAQASIKKMMRHRS